VWSRHKTKNKGNWQNLSSPIHFPLLRYPLLPLHLVCPRLWPPPSLDLSLVALLFIIDVDFSLPGNIRTQYEVTVAEVFRYVDVSIFRESSFGYRPANSNVKAAGNKAKDNQDRVPPSGWKLDEYTEVCLIFHCTDFHVLSFLFTVFSSGLSVPM